MDANGPRINVSTRGCIRPHRWFHQRRWPTLDGKACGYFQIGRVCCRLSYSDRVIENRASGKLRTAAALFVLAVILAAVPAVLAVLVGLRPDTDVASMGPFVTVSMALSVLSFLLIVISIVLCLYGVADHFEQQHEWNKRQGKLLEHMTHASVSGQTNRIGRIE